MPLKIPSDWVVEQKRTLDLIVSEENPLLRSENHHRIRRGRNGGAQPLKCISFQARFLSCQPRKFMTCFAILSQVGFLLLHRAVAARLAIAVRCSGVSLAARALPPFKPPRRPSDTAAGSFPVSSGRGSGLSSTPPVAMSTMSFASWFGSRGRFFLDRSCIGLISCTHATIPTPDKNQHGASYTVSILPL